MHPGHVCSPVLCLIYLIIGRWGLIGSSAVSWWCLEILSVTRQPGGVFSIWLWRVLREGDEIYWALPLLLIVSPRLRLHLRLPYATACPAEGHAEHDGEAETQDAQEDPWGGRWEGDKWEGRLKRWLWLPKWGRQREDECGLRYDENEDDRKEKKQRRKKEEECRKERELEGKK